MITIHIKRVLLVIIGLIIYLYFAQAIAKEVPLQLDRQLSALMDGVATESFGLLTFLGETKGFVLVAIIGLLWLAFRKKDFIAAGVYLFGVGTGYGLNALVKIWHDRPRPPVEQHLVEVDSLSFPSGNAMIGLILYALIAYFIVKDMKLLREKLIVNFTAALIILLYGISRVSLHVHYPSDIIAGYALGLVWTIVWIYVYEGISKKRLAS